MRALDDLAITDKNSLRFQAAMHGFDKEQWIYQEVIKSSDTVPPELTNNTWNAQRTS